MYATEIFNITKKKIVEREMRTIPGSKKLDEIEDRSRTNYEGFAKYRQRYNKED